MKLNLNRNKRYAIPIMTHPGIELIEKTVKAAVTDGQTHADAIIAELKAYEEKGVTFILTSHYTPEDLKDAETKIAYLEKLKSLVAENADAGALAAALSAAWPGLPGDPAALAAVLYR